MKYLINIKGYKKASYINGVTTDKWWVFFITRKSYAYGVTGMETARCEVSDAVLRKYGWPCCGEVYVIEYGSHDTIDSYVLYDQADTPMKE